MNEAEQQFFDDVVRHLLTQRKQASERGACRYRTTNGLKCAGGCKIPDEIYRPAMEGINISALLGASDCTNPNFLKEWVPQLQPFFPSASLAAQLQMVHDSRVSGYSILDWPASLRSVAERWKGSMRVIDEMETDFVEAVTAEENAAEEANFS